MGYLKPVGTSLRTNNMFSLFDDFFGRDSFFKDNFCIWRLLNNDEYFKKITVSTPYE